MNEAARLLPIAPWLLRSLRDHTHEMVREAIISGRLKSGEKLNERRLAAELGISTTPLKEALRQLETEGLVRTEPRRGSYVTFNARQAEEMTLARAALESMMARQAARHVTQEHLLLLHRTLDQMHAALGTADLDRLIDLNELFHNGIHDASGCTYLRRLQNGQSMYNHATRLIVLAEESERERAFVEHKAILEAIEQRDQDLADRLMREHVILAGEKHVRAVFGAPDPEKN